MICYMKKLQGATCILQKINWSEAPANNILQVCALKVNTCTSAFCFLYSLIFFLLVRDGVSEGQFYQVLLYELNAIRRVSIWPNQAWAYVDATTKHDLHVSLRPVPPWKRTTNQRWLLLWFRSAIILDYLLTTTMIRIQLTGVETYSQVILTLPCTS